MYLHARRIGLSPDEFWSLTLREYSRECAAAAARARDDYNRDMTQAWNEIRLLGLGLSKGLPTLKTQLALEPEEKERAPSMAYQRAVVEVIAAQHNLTMRPISPAAKAAMRKMRAEMDAARN